VEVFVIKKRGPLQPLLNQVEQRPLLFGGLHSLPIIGLKPGGVFVTCEKQTVSPTETQLVFDDAELRRLKTGRREEVVAEVEKVEGCHRLKDPDHLDEEFLDLGDSPKPAHRRSHLHLVDRILFEDFDHTVEFPDDLLEPQLI
jgi:hypothetical protein